MSDYQTDPFTKPVPPGGGMNGDAYPAPPQLHWALVLLFTLLTLGIFMIVWMFIQSTWVRKINPASNVTTQFAVYLVLAILGQFLVEGSDNLEAVGLVVMLASYVVFYFGAYSMRRSMLDHYNSVEPMQLKLSAAMVFLFSIFYFQYHMTRIARWKAASKLAI
ncbi:hypothetical protein [Polaromonas aquatica]|uniref:hypothetical protein n=1 Tax=Polaromonas aquatica TaxID=332657 RepID=UPI003D64C11D